MLTSNSNRSFASTDDDSRLQPELVPRASPEQSPEQSPGMVVPYDSNSGQSTSLPLAGSTDLDIEQLAWQMDRRLHENAISERRRAQQQRNECVRRMNETDAVALLDAIMGALVAMSGVEVTSADLVNGRAITNFVVRAHRASLQRVCERRTPKRVRNREFHDALADLHTAAQRFGNVMAEL